jgi:hypothetical protein
MGDNLLVDFYRKAGKTIKNRWTKQEKKMGLVFKNLTLETG